MKKNIQYVFPFLEMFNMGEHKYNPTAIAAKNGTLKKKKKPKKDYIQNIIFNAVKKCFNF